MDKKTASWVAYLTFVGAIIVLVSIKDDREVRTHAWQSIFFSCFYAAVCIVLAIINGIILAASPWAVLTGGFWFMSLISTLLWLAFAAVSIICIVKAVQGGIFKIPVIYGLAEKRN